MRAFLMVLLFGTFAHAAPTCPLGPKDDHLTIQRVMINFGKFTMNGDTVVREGASASQPEIDQAVNDLAVVQACAQAVVDGTSEDLLPVGAAKLSGSSRDQFINDFKSVMAEFSAAIVDYSAALTAHDFVAAKAAQTKWNKITDEAHSKF